MDKSNQELNIEQIVFKQLLDAKNKIHTCSVCDYLIKGKDHLGQKTINQYSIEEMLGRGSFGTVFKVSVNETHERYAMKTFSKNELKK